MTEPIIATKTDPEDADTPHGRELRAAMYRIVDQLENEDPRSQRMALQMLQALARYEGELLPIATTHIAVSAELRDMVKRVMIEELSRGEITLEELGEEVHGE